MRNSITVDYTDIKKILAEKYGVKVEEVIKNQYSYTVLLDEIPDENEKQDVDSPADVR